MKIKMKAKMQKPSEPSAGKAQARAISAAIHGNGKRWRVAPHELPARKPDEVLEDEAALEDAARKPDAAELGQLEDAAAVGEHESFLYCHTCGQTYIGPMANNECNECRLKKARRSFGMVNVYRLRGRLGVSQDRLALLLMISKRTVVRWEAGEVQTGPSAFLLFALELASQEPLVLPAAKVPSILQLQSFWAVVFASAEELSC